MNRNIGTCVILSIVTCGIYSIYWVYMLNKDVATLSGKAPKFSDAAFILLWIFTCGIFPFIWMYTQGDTIDQINKARGKESSNTGIIYLLLSIFGLGIVSVALMQDQVNTLAG